MLGLELNMTHYGEHFAFALFLRENPLVIGQINDDTTGVNINKLETFYVVVKIKYSNPLHKEENDNRVA